MKEGKACYHWMTKVGCKLGKECRFNHDRATLSAAPDVSNRCFMCSGLGHRAVDCPTGKSSAAARGSGEPEKGKGGKGDGKQTSCPNAKRIEEDKPVEGEQAKLLSAATSLLEQLQTKALSERIEIRQLEG